VRSAKRKMTCLYEEYKSQEDVRSPSPIADDSNERLPYDINNWRFAGMNKLEDELTRYLKATLLILNPNEEFDLLTWWRGNSQEYPVLSRIAIDIFSIPAMSVEPERVFSGYDWTNSGANGQL